MHLLVTSCDIGTQKGTASPAADQLRTYHLATIGTLDSVTTILDCHRAGQLTRKLLGHVRLHNVLTQRTLNRVVQQQSPARRTGLNRNTHKTNTQATDIHRPTTRSLPPQ